MLKLHVRTAVLYVSETLGCGYNAIEVSTSSNSIYVNEADATGSISYEFLMIMLGWYSLFVPRDDAFFTNLRPPFGDRHFLASRTKVRMVTREYRKQPDHVW